MSRPRRIVVALSGASGAIYARRTLALLAIWAFVGFGCSILFVEQLNAIEVFGVPFGFWMAQQGSIFVFIALILFYAIMNDRDEKSAQSEEAL